MPALEFTHVLSAPPEIVWDKICTPTVLSHISAPLLTLHPLSPLPEKWTAGERVTFKLYLLGWIPWGAHEIHFLELNSEQCSFLTSEKDPTISVWNHSFHIEIHGPGECVARDRIEYEAGRWNAFVRVFSNVLYRHRYRRLKRLLSSTNR